MARINIHKNPLEYNPEVIEVEGGINLISALENQASWVGSAESVAVSLNGELLGNSAKDDLNELCNIQLKPSDQIDIYAAPQGDPISLGTLLLISAGFAVASYLLLPIPSVPNNAGNQKSSPNNQANAATNEYRKNQAEADVYGSTRVFPDLDQPSWYEYVSNRRVFTEFMRIGIGHYTVDAVRSEQTPVDSYTVYQPGDTIPPQLRVIGTTDVDGFSPPAPDDPNREASLDGATIQSPNFIFGFDPQSIDIQVGDIVEIDITWTSTIGTETATGFYEVGTVDAVSVSLINPTPNWNESDVEGNAEGWIRNTAIRVVGDWYTLVGDDIEEIFYQIIMPQGIRADNGGEFTVALRLYWQPVDANGDPAGSEDVQQVSFTGSTLQDQRKTFKITPATPGRYRARVVRESLSAGGQGVDRVQVEDIQSVRQYTPSVPDACTMVVKRQGTINAISQRQSKINADVIRKLELFDPTIGAFDTGNFTATESFAQACMDTLRRANEPLENINYNSLFDIENSLSQPELGHFSFSFDDEDISVGQRIETICNVARVKAYKALGTVWTFVRDEAKPMAVKYFNRRNIHGDLTISRKHLISDEFDSIELKWIDPISNDERFERRRINNTTGAIETGLGVRTQEITLAGCRNQTQAVNRVELEIRRLKYSRYNLSGQFSSEALTIGPMNKIAIGDINDTQTFDGEITAIESGGLYHTTEPFEPEAGKTYMVMISEADGDVGLAVTATAHPDTTKGFSAPDLSGAIVADGYEVQLGSRYLIATEDDMVRSHFSVIKRGSPDEFGRTEVEATEYNDNFYEMD